MRPLCTLCMNASVAQREAPLLSLGHCTRPVYLTQRDAMRCWLQTQSPAEIATAKAERLQTQTAEQRGPADSTEAETATELSAVELRATLEKQATKNQKKRERKKAAKKSRQKAALAAAAGDGQPSPAAPLGTESSDGSAPSTPERTAGARSRSGGAGGQFLDAESARRVQLTKAFTQLRGDLTAAPAGRSSSTEDLGGGMLGGSIVTSGVMEPPSDPMYQYAAQI